ncbi:putative aminodeoxychorismate lyase [Variibacter gotjawalensis]|uniref:Endolytic murein transglycosylase n=1 Tax=Variibacter gotjawalensis TaxID=1333996 RepID=A0A0S3PYJ5_9BRAD|nr:endolytic transglycosylase MltG [Variibacter gotjawalensis]NIK46808.1 UPF0755 protein [Variibacter gotjawalensis]RZS48712.1 UPF0755 protein [Variibacter gotjawalensis]BAT60971.1 putative aminodeoxychorismate lyase [Variibacter gotjawalensis]
MTDASRPDGAPEIPAGPPPEAGPAPLTRRERRRLEKERIRAQKRATRASRRTRHPFIIVGSLLFTFTFFLGIAALIGFTAGRSQYEEVGPLQQEKIVNVSGGTLEIADLLAREGVMDGGALAKTVFFGMVQAAEWGTKKEEPKAGAAPKRPEPAIKRGEYLFAKGVSIRGVIEQLTEGKVVQHQITLPEGLTSQQMVARLVENPILSGQVREIPKEGALLPDTYNFPRGFPRDQLLQSLQAAQRRVLQQVWDRRSPDSPVKTPEQLLTLASIVEKETGKAEERTRVAGVFANRLRMGMKLQSDPTTVYGLVGGKGSLGRQLMRRELEQPTPYNTYVISGLPPGPIANPGRASLEAAANPMRHKEIFFVADGTGGHAFAETLEQHNRNVARLRELERQRGQTGAPAPTIAPPTAVQPPAPAPNAPRAQNPTPQGTVQQ